MDIVKKVAALTAIGDNAPGVAKKLDIIQKMSDADARVACIELLNKQMQSVEALEKAKEAVGEMEALIRTLTEAPLQTGVFKNAVDIGGEKKALMADGSVIETIPEINIEEIAEGSEVYTTSRGNCILQVSGDPDKGETAKFDRWLDKNRIIVKARDEEIILKVSSSFRKSKVKPDDLVMFNKEAAIAYEVIEKSKGESLFLEDTPVETFNNIGGLVDQIEEIKRTVQMHMNHPKLAQKYKLRRKGSVLLVGPAGTGKTMMARALANWVAKISKSGKSKFMNIKPSGLHSMWYGQSEANYREAFRVAKEAGQANPDIPVIMFFDEIDSIGMARGGEYEGQLGDRVLTAFMAELDGLESRGNILVVAATNRKDALDPALIRPGRLGDCVLTVPRPDKKAATDIFSKYLVDGLPYKRNGSRNKKELRKALIEHATSVIFSEDNLARIKLSTGELRSVLRSDLVNGSIISNVVRAACEMACFREIKGGKPGLTKDDLESIIVDEFNKVAETLTPSNAHRHLVNLPPEARVARVQHVEK